jgi:flagellar secretion chaperone FliS
MMNTKDSAFAYQQSTAFGASAVGQVVALYDRILRDLRLVSAAIDAGQIENRVNAMNHALTIMGELQGVLDFQRGGEAARHLNSFYNVSRAMAMEAGVACSPGKIQELISMFTRLRAAWSCAERSVAPSEPTERFRISSQQQPAQPQIAPAPQEPAAADSATGGWRA